MYKTVFFFGLNLGLYVLVYGIAHPGELLVIMGPSGAGKSTLLNALTFQSGSNTSLTGFRYLNGRVIRSRNDISNVSAYVEQTTLFLGNLTVREHLIFHAMIRMDKTVTYEQKIQRVDDVIAEVLINYFFFLYKK